MLIPFILKAKTAPIMENKPEDESPTPYQAPFNSHDESSQASPAPARKRRRTSPNRTEEESTPISKYNYYRSAENKSHFNLNV